MLKTFTPTTSPASTTKDSRHMSPRKDTIDFIRQFARAYSMPQREPSSLPGLVLN